jgi:hypothetical protein
MGNKRKLKILSFEDCELNDHNVLILMKILKNNTDSIVKFSFLQNQSITSRLIEALSEHFKQSKLKELFLSRNIFDIETLLHFTSFFSSFVNLEVLYLNKCEISDEMLMAIFTNIGRNTKKLSLMQNNGSDLSTIKHLCTILKGWNGSIHIDLRKNKFPSKCLTVLAHEGAYIKRKNLQENKPFVDLRENVCQSESTVSDLEILSGELFQFFK